MAVTSLATSVSLPGTIVIFTQMSGLAALKALTMLVRLSVSGGVWLVQNLTTVALAAQLAPVTGVGSALPPAAGAEALAAPLAGGAADVRGLVVVLVHAPSTRVIAAPSANHRNRPERGLMAPPTRLLRTVAEKDPPNRRERERRRERVPDEPSTLR
jgi:hypothetical protein